MSPSSRGVALDRLARAQRQHHRRPGPRGAGEGAAARARLHREPARAQPRARAHPDVAVVVPDLGNPTFQAILRGLSRAAAADGYHVLIADSAESVDEERLLAVETRRRTDGLILCAPRMPDDELARSCAASARSCSSTARPTTTSRPSRRLPRRARRAHGAPVRARPPPPRLPRGRRAQRLERRATRGDRAASARPPRRRRSRAAVRRRLRQRRGRGLRCARLGRDAVLAYNDLVAMGLLSAVQASGCRIPADLSIVGFDDIPFARYTSPPLTTAAVPAAELGARAWAAMRGAARGRGAAEPVTPRARGRRARQHRARAAAAERPLPAGLRAPRCCVRAERHPAPTRPGARRYSEKTFPETFPSKELR